MSVISSEESRKLYAERKKQVLQLLETATNFYKEDVQEKAGVFSKLYSDLENGEFSIVVVGEFSAGKSTLLNALMGNRILPSFSNETTATVNFLRHKTKSCDGEAGRVFYSNNTQEVIEDASLDTIMKYVSTKGDDVAKKVDHLDLYLDSNFLCDGVTLVDSPGLNGVADGHREITEAQILKSHACIFLFNSDHPGSKTDFDFLNDLQNKVQTIIFVLNKIDEIKLDEGETPETVIDTLKKTYKTKFPEATSVPEIWPVAAYPALVARNDTPLEYHDKINRTEDERKKLEDLSRLRGFENRLLSFLTCGEKTKQQLLSPIDKVISLSIERRKECEEEKNILENTVDSGELEEQISSIEEAINSIEKRILDSRNEITRDLKESLREITEELAAQMSRLQDRKLAEIDEIDDFDDLVSYLKSFEKNFIQRVYSIALDQEENLREKILMVIQLQYSAQAGNIESALLDSTSKISLSASEHLDTSERFFEVGLKDMEEKSRVLQDQIHVLETEVQTAEDDFYKERKIERKIGELKNEIKDLQDRKETVEAQMLPPVERYTEERHTKEHRGGLLGTIGWFFLGGKNVTHYEQKEDSQAHDAAAVEKKCKTKELSKEIEKKQEELKSMEDVDSSLAERIYIRKMAEVDAKRQKLEALTKEHTHKIEEKYAKEIKKLKRELTSYCDAITDELNTQVKRALRALEQEYIGIVVETVAASLRVTLEKKKHRIEQIEKQMKNSEENRNARILELHTKIMKINELIGQASDLKVDLESIDVDTIKREAI